MKTAIIVLNYNLPELTDRLCEDLIRRTKCDYDLYVIENGSSPDELSKYCTHYLERNIRVSGGLNYGIRQAMSKDGYDALWCLFNDVSFDQEGDVLSFMLRCMEAYPRIGIMQPCWGNEWILDGSANLTKSGKRLSRPLVSVIAADPLCMLFRAEMIEGITARLGPNNDPLWDETNRRNHANAELIQAVGYRNGWVTASTGTFTASELREHADAHSEKARGEDDAEWKSAGAVEREEWIRQRWRDVSFFFSPNLSVTRNPFKILRNAYAYARLWLDLSRPGTSGKACWRHVLELCKREYQNFILRHPEYAEMALEV